MPFTVFPAVDILEGRCVQLRQGVRESQRGYGEPLRCAHKWLNEGAEALHVVNLDGAFGESRANAELIRLLIQETEVTIQLGGGIRSVADAAAWLEIGVSRVILGTLTVREPECIQALAAEFGPDRVMAGVDVRGGQLVVNGWREPAGDYLVWANRFEELGAGSLLFTNVDIEGLEKGIQLPPLVALLETTALPVVAAGGISSADDVRALRDLGASGAVLGSALYSGKIRLKDALEAAR